MNFVPPVHLQGLVFAAHPTTRGFGWILFERPLKPVAWGTVHADPKHDGDLIVRFEELLDKYEPAVVVLEAFEGPGTQRAERIRALCRLMVREIEERAIENPIFDRAVIRAAFAEFGVSTRPDIAQVIAKSVVDISHLLPPKRNLGDSENIRQSLFDAAALALTYFVYRGDTK